MGRGRRTLVLIQALLLFLFSATLAQAVCSDSRVQLRGPWGQTEFFVQVADTNASRARGLMFVEEMAENVGMLFVYERAHRATFWMKNTLIPLDMIFVTPEGRVQLVHENAIPGDLTGISGGQGVIAVLEINGGLARQIGIGPGSELRHPRLDQSIALWPCE